jgi:hypothetical protein
MLQFTQRVEWILAVFLSQVVTFGIRDKLSLCHGLVRVSCVGCVVTVWHMRRHWTYRRGQEKSILNLCPIW